jgi:hypothetical protein
MPSGTQRTTTIVAITFLHHAAVRQAAISRFRDLRYPCQPGGSADAPAPTDLDSSTTHTLPPREPPRRGRCGACPTRSPRPLNRLEAILQFQATARLRAFFEGAHAGGRTSRDVVRRKGDVTQTHSPPGFSVSTRERARGLLRLVCTSAAFISRSDLAERSNAHLPRDFSFSFLPKSFHTLLGVIRCARRAKTSVIYSKAFR